MKRRNKANRILKVMNIISIALIVWAVASYFNIVLNNLNVADHANYWSWNLWILLCSL